MSRASFFSPMRSSRDSSPLLPQHRSSVSLQDLSPRPSSARTVSPSPPPSFYRDLHQAEQRSRTYSHSPSLSRPKPRKIQFTAPPPPIASSLILPPSDYGGLPRKGDMGVSTSNPGRDASPRFRRGSGGIDPLLALERREKAIHGDLQLLLDAQSAGLVQGFGGNGEKEGGSDAGSSTPTARTDSRRSRERGVVPVRQPKKRVIGLRGARRGLLRDMGELVLVKDEEMLVLSNEIGKREETLDKVDIWEKRIEGVKGQLSGAVSESAKGGSGEEAREIAELKTEQQAVENEIRELEDRLAQMRARKNWIGERIKESVNRNEARLSSYRGALREVESEVKEFLKQPPLPVSIVMADQEGFMTLPASRRTLGMAKEWWNKESLQLQTRKQAVQTERAALEEGAALWKDSMQIVTEFEDDLRAQMACQQVHAPSMLQDQISKMRTVIEKLGDILQVAEEKGWNLLICAVGAELEAFKEGEQILTAALEISDVGGGDQNAADVNNGQSEDTNGLNRNENEEREDSEDDGPNLAELLVDRGDQDNTS